MNNDGMLYIEAAEAYLEGGFKKAMTVFSWPFLPITISWFHSLTGASLESSGYIINTVLLIIASIAFLRVYEEIDPTNLPLWIPALFILALPVFNDYRGYLIRGHGFWAFTLLALYFFIRYSKNPSHRLAILWQGSIILATLFRIEGIVFIALAPFYFLINRDTRKGFLAHFVKLNSIVIPASITAAFIILNYIFTIEGLSRDLQLRLSYILPSTLLKRLYAASAGIEELMPRLSSNEAILVASAGLIVLITFKLAKNINLLLLAVWAYGHNKRWLFLSKESNIVLYFALISVIYLIVITGNTLFISSRYTVITVALLSIIPCQYLTYLFHKLRNDKRNIASAILLSLVVLFFLDAIIHTGANQHSIVTASKWVTSNIDRNSNIACTSKRFAFYSKRCTHHKRWKDTPEGINKLINNTKYDHLLLWVSHKDTTTLEYLKSNKQLILLKSFKNKKNDASYVYRIERQ
jgi:hypothetical protein